MDENQSPASPLPFLHLVERLKQTARRGWEIRDIPSPESVSDHMHRMALMVMLTPGINEGVRTHAVKMALVHDLGEALIGDITPSDGIPKEEKYTRERLALLYLSCLAKPVSPSFAEEIMALWYEFEEGTSEAAHLVQGIDALECMTQAVEYEDRLHCEVNLKEFMELESVITTPQLKDWVGHLKQERQDLWDREKGDILVLFVLGGPGVGKGTQCARLAHSFKGIHISVGDLLREEESSPDSVFADFINESIRNSVIIPADLTIGLLRKKIVDAQRRGSRLFIVDGFPRSVDQASAFEKKIHKNNHTILLQCGETELQERLSQRAKSSGRVDDNPESIIKRLRTFSTENGKVEEHLRRAGDVFQIDATGSIEEVHSSMKKVVEKLVNPQL